jgi:hypothetical protein
MINLPELQVTQKNVLSTTTFLGYNHQEIIQDGEMYDMKNLSGDKYPLLSLRKKRAKTCFEYAGEEDPLLGINGRDQLTFILGSKVYWNFLEVEGLSVSTAENMQPKKIVNFGAYVCIFPDKKYFNTVNLSDCGSMEKNWDTIGNAVGLSMCRGDGTDYDMTQIAISTTAPTSPTNGKLWIDQSGDNDVLRQYSSATETWTEVATTYVKISATNIGAGLQEYDCLTLAGLTAPDTSSDRVKAQVSALNGSAIVYYCGTNYIVVAGLLSQTLAALKNVNVSADMKIPDMDFIVEANNRLWGCKYGMRNGQVVNEIRCSALGSFRNWIRFMGNSQDSWVGNVGTDGPFTAAVTQKGYPVFMKENCIHRVSGSTPGTFQLSSTVCRGTQLGSWRSAVVVNEAIYYKSRQDVLMYDGSMPVSVGEKLGGVLYSDARAGAVGDKYYISMKDRSGEWHLFNYDTKTGIWHKEDNLHAMGFGRVDDELFCIDEGDNTLVSINGSVGEIEDDFPWSATFGLFGTDYTGQKYLSRFNIRMYLDPWAEAKLEIRYDGEGEWQEMGTVRGSRVQSFLIPVIPRRCDHLQVRISGEGDCRIYQISREMEAGGDG